MNSRNRQLVACVCLAALMESLDCFIVCISLPAITATSHVPPATGSLVLTAYFTPLAATLLLYGQLGRRFGQHNLFLWGILFFTMATILCSLAPSINWLLLARVIQGTAAGAFISVSSGLLAENIEPKMLGRSFGYRSMAQSIGIFVATPLGGFISHQLGWRWIFLVTVPFGLVALGLLLAMISKRRIKSAVVPYSVNLVSLITSMLFILLFILFFQLGEYYGWLSLSVSLIGAAAIFFLLVFIVSERRASAPMVDLSIIRKRHYSLSLLSSTGVMMVLSGNMFLFPYFLTRALKLNLTEAGQFMLIYPATSVLFALISGKLSDRYGPVRLMQGGTFFLLLSFVFFTPEISVMSLWSAALFILLFSLGINAFLPSTNHLVMSVATLEQKAEASSMLRLSMRLGMTLGIALAHLVLLFEDEVTQILRKLVIFSSLNTQDPFFVATEICYGMCAIIVCVSWFLALSLSRDAHLKIAEC